MTRVPRCPMASRLLMPFPSRAVQAARLQHLKGYAGALVPEPDLFLQTDELDGVETEHGRETLPIVNYPNPVLRAPNALVTKFDMQLQNFVRTMFNTMYLPGVGLPPGVGLAAP